ncbi:MAG: DnaD domain protein [Clostridia bacterium]|nr:DnaD domain protein [Clostridia bacterium]
MAEIEIMNPIIPLESSFIENYLPSANPTHVAVYIYVLNLCYRNKPRDNAAIASALDILESDVIKAWKYWHKVGLISIDENGSITFLSSQNAAKPEKPKSAKIAPKPETPVRRDIPMDEITKRVESDKALSETLSMAQMIWGRPLTGSEIKVIYSILDWYSFSNEVLLMLLEYCAADEKTKSMKYLESTAEGWAADGITSVKAAEKVLKKKEKERTMLKKCAAMFSLERAFSDREAEYIANWTNTFGMSEAMIKEAYARTTVNTGKLSFPYMNKILESWHKSGIKTIAALKEAEGTRGGKPAKQQSNYDFDDIERREFERRMKKNDGEA